jgi:putative membrane protein
MGYDMQGWDHMMGYGGYGGIFMWLILLIVAVVIVYFLFMRHKQTGNAVGSEKESPAEILRRRYARGEISREEFERLKKDIES